MTNLCNIDIPMAFLHNNNLSNLYNNDFFM